jgi:hypothetical protein
VRLVASLAWARLRYRPLRRALVVLGVAAATVLPVLAQASAGVVAADALQHGIDALPAGQRSVVVSAPGIRQAPADLAGTDRLARTQLARIAPGTPRHEMVFRTIADRTGAPFHLGAADDLASAVRLTSGRLPSSCTPRRCEVVVVGQGTPALQPYLGLVVVGRAERTDPLLLTGTFDPGHDGPLLLADGVAAAQALDSLALFQRTYGWVAPLDLRLVRQLGVDGWSARSSDVADDLYRGQAGLVLTAPDDVLRAEAARARLSAQRFTLLTGAATVVLLGFCLVAAVGLRRDHLAFRALLRRRGAALATVQMLSAVEAAVPVLAGALLGLAVGAGVAAAAGDQAGLPVGSATAEAVRGALPAVAVSTVLAVAVVAATLGWPAGGPERTAWRVVDGIVVAGLATAALALARGTVSTASLSSGTDPLLMALPVLVAACGGLLAARFWPLVTAAAGRAVPARWLATRLALLGASRRPLRSVATVAFVTATTGVVVFGGSYRATLAQGAADQAAYQVPLAATVTTGSTLDRPLDVAELARYDALAPGATAYPVVRAGAALRVSAVEATPVQLVGVEPRSLTSVASWAHVVGAGDPARTGALLATPAGGTATVPTGARAVVVPVTGDLPQLQIVLWFRAPDGRDLAATPALAGGVLTAPVPPGAAEGRLLAVTLAESTAYATKHQHHIGEGGTDVAVVSGHLDLGTPRFAGVDGRPLGNGSWAGWGSTGAHVSARGSDGLEVAYALTGAQVVVTPGFAGRVLPALVDPATAARAVHGTLSLGLGSGPPLLLHVAAVAPRFPTTNGGFAVVDERALADAMDTRQPGTGAVAELWVDAPASSSVALADALAAPPYDRLSVSLRAAVEQGLATDPVAVGSSRLLLASALLAAFVALVAVVLLVVADRRDEQAELYAWESDGVQPRTLRRSLFVRVVAVVLVAVPAGVLLGVVLSGLTTALVTVTAVGTTPVPPLARAVGPGWAAGVLGAGLVVALAAAAGVCAAALREPLPVPPEEDPR